MKKYHPTSPGRRQMEVLSWRSMITRTAPEKALTAGFFRSRGRNADGRITVRHKGGGAKRRWREIDFRYDKKGMVGVVVSVEYDPNRSGLIALLQYPDGEKRYVLAPQTVTVGSKMVTSEDAAVETGNRVPLSRIPVGTSVYNIELETGRGAKLARSAGADAVVLAHEKGYTHVELPSKEVRMVRSDCWASIGAVSNPEHGFQTIGKAGRSRRMGIRPTVRGSAMNPVDHPHGGGEGKALIGRRRGPATPWGKPARGVKTRRKKNRSNKFILQRRKR